MTGLVSDNVQEGSGGMLCASSCLAGEEYLCEPPHEDSPIVEMVTALTDARTPWFELRVLNGGGRRLKRESLKLSLDRNVKALGQALSTNARWLSGNDDIYSPEYS